MGLPEYIVYYRNASNVLTVKDTTVNSKKEAITYATQQEAFDAVKDDYPSDSIFVAKLQERVDTNTWTDPVVTP
jgi:hypothetical protein